MSNPIIQVVVLGVLLIVFRLLRRLPPFKFLKRVRYFDLLPVLCLWFMWLLAHRWDDPWFATVIVIWMLISIGLTLAWGLSKGELLWNRFLLFYWRISAFLLLIMYVVTLVSNFLR
ncbi:hypothetical protein [Secundilactobacillus similis]|nr:hypothetical protein [Secundilactobacillus similis]